MHKSNVVVGPLQLEVLEVLWVEGPLDGREVYGHMRMRRLTVGQPRLVLGTILAVLRTLTFKGYVAAEQKNGRYHFTAVIERTDLYRKILQATADLVAGGDLLLLSEKAKALCNSQNSTP